MNTSATPVIKEITEADYNYFLECLPPEQWKKVNEVESFRLMEMLDINLWAYFAETGGRYFRLEGNRLSPEMIADKVQQAVAA